MDGKIKVYLDKRLDKYGQIYYIGKLQAPVSLNYSDGVSFLIFTANESEEEMQIANVAKPSKSREPKVYHQTKRKNQGV